MSVLMTASKQEPFPLHESRSGQQQGTRHWCRQLACVLILVLTDLSTIAVSLNLAIFLRNRLVPHVSSNFQPGAFPFQYYLAFGWLWLLPLLFLAVEGLYTQRRSLWTEIGYLAKAIGLSLAAILAAVALTQQVVSRLTVLLTGANLVVLLPVVRFWTKRFLGVAGLWHKRILILGATPTANLAMKGLSSDPVLGYQVVGVLDDDPAKIDKRVGVYGGQPIFVLGNLSEAPEQMKQTQAKDVLIAMPGLPEEKLLALVHEFQPSCGNVYVVPQLWGLPMMNLQVDGFLRERVPLCLIITVLINIDSEGPALFVQERLGYRGRNFRCLKFRTMYVNSDKKLAQYFESNPEAAEEWRRYAKLRNCDPRVTRLGRFLRKWSLDELPQLLNVLKGEMSLVGPRPYLPQERERIGVELPTILSARPGITGFWQVSGRNQLTVDDRVQVEAWYVRNWTVWLDCIVLLKTFRTVLFPEKGSGAGDDAVPGATGRTFRSSQSVAPALGINQCAALYESDRP